MNSCSHQMIESKLLKIKVLFFLILDSLPSVAFGSEGFSRRSAPQKSFATLEEPASNLRDAKSFGGDEGDSFVSGLRAPRPFGGDGGDSFAVSALRSTSWIKGGNGRKSVMYTPCFHNPCPKGKFTFCIESACSYTLYLVDENGRTVQTIGSGTGSPKTWTFFAPCGKFRIKIVLNCSCTCAYTRFSLNQDRSNCFNCPDPIRHTYNPDTCQCECGNQCSCSRPQTWLNFPTCSCSCPRVQKCNIKTEFWNMKTCRCEALPKCKNCGCDFTDRLSSRSSSSSPDEFVIDPRFNNDNNDNNDNGDNVNIFR